jgi:hypothetical protein
MQDAAIPATALKLRPLLFLQAVFEEEGGGVLLEFAAVCWAVAGDGDDIVVTTWAVMSRELVESNLAIEQLQPHDEAILRVSTI